MFELDPTNIASVSGGVFTSTTTAGTPVVGGTEVIASGDWDYKVYVLENQESDLSEPTINSVTGGTDGALVLNTDYRMVKTASNKWGILFISGGNITVLTQAITIDSDYTPAASVALSAGASSVTLTPKVVRFSHTDDNGKVRKLDVYSATLGDAGFTFTFGSQINDGAQSFPITLEGDIDTSRTSGQQLLTYTDEQSV